MFKSDYHVHSYKSYDADKNANFSAIIAAAKAKNLNQIVICDHYDVNWVLSKLDPDLNFSESLYEIKTARDLFEKEVEKEVEKEPNKLKENLIPELLLGIELGQPHQSKESNEKAREILEKYDFDFVLCSLHNAKDEEDFAKIDYENTEKNNIKNIERICEKYIKELCELAEWEKFDSFAHITYPERYFKINSIKINLSKYYDLYKDFFKIIIRRGIALEVNSSGLLKKNFGLTMPNFELLRIYKNLGGELLTLGSDAHNCADIYGGIDMIREQLKQIGFEYFAVMRNKKMEFERL